MRTFLPFLLVLTLLVPAQSAAAQSIVCQTPNGPRPIGVLSTELAAAGYPGPWDVASMAAAYSNASGGAATCGGIPSVSIPAPSSRTVVMLVGGLDSSLDAPNWDLLKADLKMQGFTDADFFDYSYLGWSVNAGSRTMSVLNYSQFQTCQNLSDSEDILAKQLRFVRDNHWADHVVLVGHSLGGVLAYDVLGNATDLSAGVHPFLSSVVTVDSPLGGVLPGDALVEAFNHYGSCDATSELARRHNAGFSWQAHLSDVANTAMSRGVSIHVLSNANDRYVALYNQQVDALVNQEIDVVNGWASHNALLTTTYGAAQIAGIIGWQG